MDAKKYDVVVFGSMFVDYFCYSDRLPKAGETVTGTDFKMGYGGKGANQCVAAQRLGSRAAFIGKVGNDINGRHYTEHLKSEGVDVTGIAIEEGVPTGTATIMVGQEDGENIIVVVPGSTGKLNAAYVETPNVIEIISQAKLFVCVLENPLEGTYRALEIAKSYDIPTIWNIAPAQAGLPLEMFKLADIICLNETEAHIVTGRIIENEEEAKAVIEHILSEFGARNVIITLGSKGAILYDHEDKKFHEVKIPPLSGPVVDTTGAGDCFIGTLAHCLSRGNSLLISTQHAIQNASRSVLVKGTQPSYPTSLLE